MPENTYKLIIDKYLGNNSNVDQFIEGFMEQYKNDRDNNIVNDERFQRLIDRIFASCDCYCEKPEQAIEITEKQLKDEVSLFRYIWFG
jgi:N12 class adenine-specific DNA methylase